MGNQWLVNFNEGQKLNQWCLQTRRSLTLPSQLYFDNKAVEDVHQHKHLGLIFNTRLSRKNHVSKVIANVSKMLDVTHKLSRELERKTLENIYETFIRSKLEYACTVWDDCSDQDTKAIENCQPRAARIVTGAKKDTSHEKLYCETQWSKLEERRYDFKICFMHNVVHRNEPEYLCGIIA